MNTPSTVGSQLDMIEDFLEPLVKQAEKAAADQGTSFMDTDAGRIENMSTQSSANEAGTSQTNLGNDQSALAADGGATAADSSENSMSDAENATDDQGTRTLTTDDKVTSMGNIGPRRTQEISQEQKNANQKIAQLISGRENAAKLANGILTTMSGMLKAAHDDSQEDICEGCGEVIKDDECTCGHKEAASLEEALWPSASQVVGVEAYSDMVEKAAHQAQEFYGASLIGQVKKATDVAGVTAAYSPDELAKYGGAEALLDTVAMEDPEAVLPEEMMAPPQGGGGEEFGDMMGPGPEGEEEEMLGEEGGDALEELAAALEESGVTPEELEEALTDVQALQEAGVTPEALIEAVQGEMAGEAGGEAGGEEELGDIPPELDPAAMDPAAMEAPVEKAAAALQQQIALAQQRLRS